MHSCMQAMSKGAVSLVALVAVSTAQKGINNKKPVLTAIQELGFRVHGGTCEAALSFYTTPGSVRVLICTLQQVLRHMGRKKSRKWAQAAIASPVVTPDSSSSLQRERRVQGGLYRIARLRRRAHWWLAQPRRRWWPIRQTRASPVLGVSCDV